MRRRRHFAVHDLSPEGQAVARRGYEENWTLEKTLGELKGATGEILAQSSLARWVSEQRILERVQHAQMGAHTLLASVVADPDGRPAKVIATALQQVLFERLGELGDQKAVEDLVGLWRGMDKLTLEHRRVELAARAAAADEKKAEAAMISAKAADKTAEARLEAVRQAAEKAVESLTTAKSQAKNGKVPVKALNTVLNDVYGIKRHAAPPLEPSELPHA